MKGEQDWRPLRRHKKCTDPDPESEQRAPLSFDKVLDSKQVMTAVFSYLDRGDLLACRSTYKRWKEWSIPFLAEKSALKDLIPILTSEGLYDMTLGNSKHKMISGLFPHDPAANNWKGSLPFSQLTLQSQSYHFGQTARFLSVYGRSITHLVLWISSSWETTALFINFYKDIMEKLPNLEHAKVFLKSDFELADWEVHARIYATELSERGWEMPVTRRLKSVEYYPIDSKTSPTELSSKDMYSRETVYTLLTRRSPGVEIKRFVWLKDRKFYSKVLFTPRFQNLVQLDLQYLRMDDRFMELLTSSQFIRLKYLRFGNLSTCNERLLGSQIVDFLSSVAETLETLILVGLFPWNDDANMAEILYFQRQNPWPLNWEFPFMKNLKVLDIGNIPGFVKLFPGNYLRSVPDLREISWSYDLKMHFKRKRPFTSLPPFPEDGDFVHANLQRLKINYYKYSATEKTFWELERTFSHFPNLTQLDIAFELPEYPLRGSERAQKGWTTPIHKVLKLLAAKKIQELTLRLNQTDFERECDYAEHMGSTTAIPFGRSRETTIRQINVVLQKALPLLKSVQKLVLRHFGLLLSRTVRKGILKMEGLTALSLLNVSFEHERDGKLLSDGVPLYENRKIRPDPEPVDFSIQPLPSL